MKKIISLLLCVSLLLSLLPAGAETAEESAALPAAGDVVYGFEVKEIRDFPLIGGKLVYFVHQRTGSELLYAANGDINRTFELAFRTRPQDNTGLPHVFEHICLYGSEKYPEPGLFMSLTQQTYNTFMNAFTMDAMTCYPVASLSEEQLLRYADYYINACYHPLLNDESVFRAEAWEYRMKSPEDPLTVGGVVYSEMQSRQTMADFAYRKALQTAFPGSAAGLSYGGDPAEIPDMTQEAVQEYHRRYYHPSNCLAVLYGKLNDYTAFLKLLDEAYAPYEKAEIRFEDADYTPLTEPAEASFLYPVTADADTAGQCTVEYIIVCPGMREDPEEARILDNLILLMNAESSDLHLNVSDQVPNVLTLSVSHVRTAPDDGICFAATGLQPEDAEKFRDAVDKTLRGYVTARFPRPTLEDILAPYELSMKMTAEADVPANGVLRDLAYCWALTGNAFDYAESVANPDRMYEMSEAKLLQKISGKYGMHNPRTALITVTADPGGKEREDAALAEKLEGIKNAMSEEEKQAVIARSNEEPATADLSAAVAALKAVSAESLPEETRLYEIRDVTGEDGIRRIDIPAETDGIGSPCVYLRADHLSAEELLWLRFYSSIAGSVGTQKFYWDDLDRLKDRYLYNLGISVQFARGESGVIPYLRAAWFAGDEDLDKSYGLLSEILFRSAVDSPELLLNLIAREKAYTRARMNGDPVSLMERRGLAVGDELYRAYEYTDSLDYYAFLSRTEAELKNGSGEFTEKISALQKRMKNSAGAVIGYAGSGKGIAANRERADVFLAGLAHEAAEPAGWKLPVPEKRTAVILDNAVQFNAVAATFEQAGIDENDLALGPVCNLVTDRLLTPVLREKMGAYGAQSLALPGGGIILFSYADPNIAETYQVFESVPDLLAQTEADRETLEGYILREYSQYAKPAGELTGAAQALDAWVRLGKRPEDTLEHMRRLKELTPEGVRAAAEVYRAALAGGARVTLGSAGKIGENGQLFDKVYNPFNVKDLSGITFTDVTPGSEHYAAVRFVFEKEILPPDSDTAFGAEKNATEGDLYFAVCVLVGMPEADPAAARDLLAGYGLCAADADTEAPLTGQYAAGLMAAVGANIPAGEQPDAVLTRAELAERIFRLMNPGQ